MPQLAAYESGREQLLAMSFADLEGALYDVIDRSVNKSGGDFDPERDLHSLTINRWNYGYAHELTSVWDPSVYGPVGEPAAGARARAVPERVDREQRLGRDGLHAQRDQRGRSARSRTCPRRRGRTGRTTGTGTTRTTSR